MGLEDHTEELKAARLTQVDARLAELKAEQDRLTERRKAYLPKRSRQASAKD